MPDRKYWLFKSEPTAYSFADLLAEADRTAEWDGVRNYQVRNLMRDEMKVGDGALKKNSTRNAVGPGVTSAVTSCPRAGATVANTIARPSQAVNDVRDEATLRAGDESGRRRWRTIHSMSKMAGRTR